MATIISLGTHVVPFGVSGDPNRISKLLGDFPNSLLEVAAKYGKGSIERTFCHDAGIDGWPQGDHQQELFAANFGKYIAPADLNQAISDITQGYRLAPFPSLSAFAQTNRGGRVWGGGEQWLVTLDTASLLPLVGGSSTQLHAPSARFGSDTMTAWGLRFGLYEYASILLYR